MSQNPKPKGRIGFYKDEMLLIVKERVIDKVNLCNEYQTYTTIRVWYQRYEFQRSLPDAINTALDYTIALFRPVLFKQTSLLQERSPKIS